MLNVNWQSGGSWAVLGQSFAEALAKRVPVAVIGAKEVKPSKEAVTLNFSDWRASRWLPGRRVISYIAWETSRIPWLMGRSMRKLDHVWVPSSWQRQVFIENGFSAGKIQVVPEGFDPAVFYPRQTQRTIDSPFRFLMVGKWEERKALDVLIEGFAREFSSTENVELVLHAHNPFRYWHDPTREVRRLLNKLGLPDRRIRCVGKLPLAGVADAYRQADAFVLPTRSEGWGLPILEAMGSGLPCIVTGHSGLMDFAHDGNARLIRPESFVPVRDARFFNPLLNWGTWAQPDATHLRQLMRQLVNDPAGARALGQTAHAEAIAKWTWDHAADEALRQLERLD